MKRNIAIVLACIAVCSGHAQTNTFPTAGSVGIGTPTPGSMLHLKSTGTSPWIGLDKNASEETGFRFQKAGNTFSIFTQTTSIAMR